MCASHEVERLYRGSTSQSNARSVKYTTLVLLLSSNSLKLSLSYTRNITLNSIALAMLILFLIYQLIHGGVDALPIPSIDQTTSSATCYDSRYCRQVSDIVLGCLTTVFACTWVSLHHNIPPPDSWWLDVWLSRIGMAIVALLVPEYILAVAIQDWFVAGNILAVMRATMEKAAALEKRK